jgi:hypothetical protein
MRIFLFQNENLKFSDVRTSSTKADATSQVDAVRSVARNVGADVDDDDGVILRHEHDQPDVIPRLKSTNLGEILNIFIKDILRENWREKDGQTDRQTERQTDRQINKEKERQTDMQTDRQTDR